MKQEARLALCILAGLMFAAASHADKWSVFHFKGSNPAGTIQGALVLNRDAVRTTTETGYRFETPVDFLHLKVIGSSGILDEFTQSADNPNSLTITKGEDGSTQFILLVEPAPTDPTPPGTTRTFLMIFAFDGEAPWGDSVPDRTITDAANFILGWGEIYDLSVSADEVRVSELARQLGALNAELRKIRKSLASGQK
jgi:hypothetical protein